MCVYSFLHQAIISKDGEREKKKKKKKKSSQIEFHNVERVYTRDMRNEYEKRGKTLMRFKCAHHTQFAATTKYKMFDTNICVSYIVVSLTHTTTPYQYAVRLT